MKEIFKPIKNYDNYFISNYGVVKNKKGKTIKAFNSNGYERVGLYRNGEQRFYRIHRLVAEAFVPNPKNLPFVNHKNEKRNDNYFKNLEWCDCQYNLNYGECQKKKGNTLSIVLRNRKDLSKIVYQYDLNNKFLNKFPSIQEASRKTGINYSLIGRCCNGYAKVARGYIWKFEKCV